MLAAAASGLGTVAHLRGINLAKSLAAEQQARREVEARERVAKANYLAGRSQSWLSEYPQRAMLLAIEAVRTTRQHGLPAVPAAEQALRDALATLGGRPLLGHDGMITAFALGRAAGLPLQETIGQFACGTSRNLTSGRGPPWA